MRAFSVLLLAALASGCIDPVVPRYTLTGPTPIEVPAPTPIPPPPPVQAGALNVELTVGPSSPRAGTAAAFIAYVTPIPNAAVYRWTFGDGTAGETTTSTTFHTFARSGDYAGTVSVSDDIGRTASSSTAFNVRGAPESPAPSPTPQPAGFQVTLTCSGTGRNWACNVTPYYNNSPMVSSAVTRVDWDWGDAYAPSGGVVMAHGYGVPGTYTVVVTATATTPEGKRTATASSVIVVP